MVPALHVLKTTGDKTGLFYVNPGTRIHVDSESIRTQAPVNFEVKQNGGLVLPLLTVLAGSRTPVLNVEGHLYGIEELRVSKNLVARFAISGRSSCFGCNISTSSSGGDYWIQKLQAMQGANIEVLSNSKNVKSQAVVLYVKHIELKGTGRIIADVINMITDFMCVEYDAKVDTSSRGYPAYNGPGYRSGCSYSVGAGHGGDGGYGQLWGCSSCLKYGMRSNNMSFIYAFISEGGELPHGIPAFKGFKYLDERR